MGYIRKTDHKGRPNSTRWTASLRFRIAGWYGFVVTAVLTLISLVVYFGVQHAMIQETDQVLVGISHRLTVAARSGDSPPALTSLATALLATLDIGSVNQANLPPDLHHSLGFLDLSHAAIRIVNLGDSRALVTSHRLLRHPEVALAMDKALALDGQTARYQLSFFGTGTGAVEYVVTRHCVCPNANLAIQVSMPWGRNAELLSSLRMILCATVLIGFLLATSGGWWIVASSLRSVDRLVREVQALSEADFEDASRFVPEAADGEIGRLVAAFNHLVLRLSRSLNAQRKFAEDAAHELQTPATVIRLQLEMALMRRRTESEMRSMVAVAAHEVDRISRIVDDLSFAARSEVNDADLISVNEVVDFGSLVDETILCFQAIAAAKTIVLNHSVSGKGFALIGDPEQLRQLIRNLLDNAIKYSDVGGVVDVGLTRDCGAGECDWFSFSVSDTGCGLDEEDLQHVFDRSWRSDRSSGKRGRGLGLAICERIVRRHGGSINVARRIEGGLAFSVSLPVRR